MDTRQKILKKVNLNEICLLRWKGYWVKWNILMQHRASSCPSFLRWILRIRQLCSRNSYKWVNQDTRLSLLLRKDFSGYYSKLLSQGSNIVYSWWRHCRVQRSILEFYAELQILLYQTENGIFIARVLARRAEYLQLHFPVSTLEI